MEKFLGKPIKPTNVPIQLQAKEFSGRDVGEGSADDFLCFCRQHGIKANDAFIKSAELCKDDSITVGEYHLDALAGKKLQFSTPLPPIVSEWRIFAWRGRIADCRCYSADSWLAQQPDKEVVERMVKAYTNSPLAYTLDVAVCRTEDSFAKYVLECHNFVSCGLYGLDAGMDLLNMLSAGWSFEFK